MRVVFMGSPEFAAESLLALILASGALGLKLVGVFSQPDKKAGRGQKLTPTAVKSAALKHGLAVFTPSTLKATEQGFSELEKLKPDLIVVAAYGLLLPKAVLELPRFGCINVHASLLPRWRGAAPIHRALLAGDSETGITIMQMDEGLDTGDMLLKASTPISAAVTTPELHDTLATLGAKCLLEALANLNELQQNAEPQDNSQANYAKKLSKAEAKLSFDQPARDVDLTIRGLAGWPVAQTTYAGKPLRLHASQLGSTVDQAHKNLPAGSLLGVTDLGLEVVCADGNTLAVTTLQFAGKKAMSVWDAARGHSFSGCFE